MFFIKGVISWSGFLKLPESRRWQDLHAIVISHKHQSMQLIRNAGRQAGRQAGRSRMDRDEDR